MKRKIQNLRRRAPRQQGPVDAEEELGFGDGANGGAAFAKAGAPAAFGGASRAERRKPGARRRGAIGAARGLKGYPTGAGGGGNATAAFTFALAFAGGATLGATSDAFQIAFDGTLLRLGKHNPSWSRVG